MIEKGQTQFLIICRVVILIGTLIFPVNESPATDTSPSNNVSAPIEKNIATIVCGEILSKLWINECESCFSD